MKSLYLYAVSIAALGMTATLCSAEPGLQGRDMVTLETQSTSVGIDVGGGSIVDFHLKGHGLNPLTWGYPEEGDTKPRPMGHFVCCDRWGQPSKAEAENGMPFHGEATRVRWEVTQKPETNSGAVCAKMSCTLPMAGMELHRTVKLDETEPVFTVTEKIVNTNNLGRVYNIVQHSTIAPPFLDESVIVDTKVEKGLMRGGSMPFPEEPPAYWPKAVFEGQLFDFRLLKDDIGPGVASFVVDENDRYGWATACNASKGLLIGYIWNTDEYPWLNLWYSVTDGKPSARGIEFGTTGLHEPFGVLLEKNTVFGRKIWEYIDAGETIEKTYHAFLAKIPADYRGVEELQFKNGTITLRERESDSTRDIVVRVK